MRVAKLTEVRKIEVVEGEKPEISSEYDVQVKVKAVGICGTDLHIFNVRTCRCYTSESNGP